MKFYRLTPPANLNGDTLTKELETAGCTQPTVTVVGDELEIAVETGSEVTVTDVVAAHVGGPTPEQANAATLRDRAIQALQANRDFLAKTNPTNAEVVAQVKLLTRECSGLIRLLLHRFEDTE